MLRRLGYGLVAGSIGTVALNVITYLDMVVRGRPSSPTPAKVAGRLIEDVADADLAFEHEQDTKEAEQTASNRRSGIGALFGYVTGLGVGAAYGLVRPSLRSIPKPVSGLALGAAAMAGTDVPATVLGVTNPREWAPSSWAADIVPHAVYGFVTAIAFDALWREPEPEPTGLARLFRRS